MTDERTYIKVHDGIEDHPKIVGLSDRAFRLLITTWGWCSRHQTDGRVRMAVWNSRSTAKARKELLDGDLAEVCEGFVQMHDYLEHQTSSALIEEKREAKRRGGMRGNHRRWHVGKGTYDSTCEFCLEDAPSSPSEDSHNRSHSDSHTDRYPDRIGISPSDRKKSPETETETEVTTYVGREAAESSARENGSRGASGPTAAEAHRLVRQVIGTGFPATTCTDLAIRTAELLREYDPNTLVEALTEWRSRTGIGPGVLPSLVADVVKRRNGSTAASSRPSTTDQRVAAVQALKNSDLRQLPGGAA